jgi:hypothetical protein
MLFRSSARGYLKASQYVRRPECIPAWHRRCTGWLDRSAAPHSGEQTERAFARGRDMWQRKIADLRRWIGRNSERLRARAARPRIRRARLTSGRAKKRATQGVRVASQATGVVATRLAPRGTKFLRLGRRKCPHRMSRIARTATSNSLAALGACAREEAHAPGPATPQSRGPSEGARVQCPHSERERAPSRYHHES